MHAHAQPSDSANRPCLVRADSLQPGQPFLRVESRTEVLVPLSYAAQPANDSGVVWAVVIGVNAGSAGFIPGQIVRLRDRDLVRPVHEARGAIYAMEH